MHIYTTSGKKTISDYSLKIRRTREVPMIK